MTPKEKALELYKKMGIEWIGGTTKYPELSPSFLIPQNPYVKQCALIAVEEILAKHFDDWDEDSEWWNEVKTEIENL